MINISKQHGKESYRVMEYIVDTATEVNNLPKDVAPGSVAFCVATGDIYMLNGQKVWVKI